MKQSHSILPNYVPGADEATKRHLEEHGVILKKTKYPYAAYEIPEGWSTVDHSDYKKHRMSFYILDAESKARFAVKGRYKDIFDCQVSWMFYDAPYRTAEEHEREDKRK